jgi:hypothetical protein
MCGVIETRVDRYAWIVFAQHHQQQIDPDAACQQAAVTDGAAFDQAGPQLYEVKEPVRRLRVAQPDVERVLVLMRAPLCGSQTRASTGVITP